MILGPRILRNLCVEPKKDIHPITAASRNKLDRGSGYNQWVM